MADTTKSPSATTTTITTTPLPASASARPPVPPTFAPGPKLSTDGKTVFHKDPVREAFDKQWRERVARGEDPLKALTTKVESTGSSSFVEIWWRKARGKEKTRKGEREAQEKRRLARVEGGRVGLLEEREEGGEDEDGEGEEREGRAQEMGARQGSEGGKKGRGKLHDRLRWGL